MRLRNRLLIPSLVLAVLGPMLLAAPSSAATTSLWAGWAPLTGVGGAFTTSVTVANNPQLSATVTSDSRAGQVGVISGASVWLPQGSPVGAKYGSSINQPYLNLRPKADNAASPSTTTYSFATPAPPSGWAFVLGDIDADKVRVVAIGPDGVALTAAQLGFRGGFNYCAPGVVGKPSCTGVATDVPTWDATTSTLTGNTGATDTSGSSGWFEPSASIASLTFVFTQRSGLPVYQTWFASLARDISGTVADQATGPVDGVPVTLTDRTGRVVATGTTSGGGRYAFAGYLATDGYEVSIGVPAGKIAVGSTTRAADLTAADAVADFTIRDIVPVAVGGTVRDSDGNPVAGATVTINNGVGTATTGPDGTYLFDTVPTGTHTITVTPLDGYSASGPLTITVPVGVETPISGQDFTLTANPDVSGRVTASGAGVAGVTVTATPAGGGTPVSTVTAGDGTYSFPRVPAGGYTIAVQPPADFVPSGPDSRPVTVATTDVTGVDFALARTGSIGGTVVNTDGAAVAGATVVIDGPGGPTTLTTDANGGYGAGPLSPGAYTITLTVPDGYTADGPATRSVTITDAGEAIADQDFAVAADPVVPPTTPPTTPPITPPDTGTAGGSPTGEIADTGSRVDSSVGPGLLLAVALVAAGAAALSTAGLRARGRDARRSSRRPRSFP